MTRYESWINPNDKRAGPLSSFWTTVSVPEKNCCCCCSSPWNHKRASLERSPSASSSLVSHPLQPATEKWKSGGPKAARWRWKNIATPPWESHRGALGKEKKWRYDLTGSTEVSHGTKREIMTSTCLLESFKQAQTKILNKSWRDQKGNALKCTFSLENHIAFHTYLNPLWTSTCCSTGWAAGRTVSQPLLSLQSRPQYRCRPGMTSLFGAPCAHNSLAGMWKDGENSSPSCTFTNTQALV